MPHPFLASHHLVGVWNPSYESDAMDAHIQVLLAHARAFRDGRCSDDDVYVWWGRIRSPRRQAPLPHLPGILALDAQLQGDAPAELHLYLTDYRSLYVAHVAEITAEDIAANPDDREHLPAYYVRDRLACDCWFRLWDIRQVVREDTLAVIQELRRLRNTRYDDHPVSLYGGMVDLPLIVRGDESTRWFDEDVRERLADGRHWVEFDAESASGFEVQADLRDNRFGTALWSALDPSARNFIATAETLFRTHRRDAAFDLSVVVVGLAKAVEVQGNRVLRRLLDDAPPEARRMGRDGSTIDVINAGPLALGELAHALDAEPRLNDWVRMHARHGDWFTSQFPPILAELADIRNRAAHGGRVTRDEVVRIRAALLGVGQQGDLIHLAETRRLGE
jgi:hypothetical protein